MLSDALALVADNTVGAISAKDVRELALSLAPAMGALEVTATAATVIATPGTFARAAGTTAALGTLRGITASAAARLTYDDTPTRRCAVRVTATLSVGAVGEHELGLTLRKGGAAIVGLVPSIVRVPGSGGPATVSCTYVLDLATGEYLEPWTTNYTSTDSVTVTGLVFDVLGSVA